MNYLERPNRSGDKIFFYYDFGRGPGQRPATGIFIYAKPKNQIEKNHNKEAKALLEVKKSQLILEQQSIGTGFIPSHKFKQNFLDYYEEYVKLNRRDGNRHLANSLAHFKAFITQRTATATSLRGQPRTSLQENGGTAAICKHRFCKLTYPEDRERTRLHLSNHSFAGPISIIPQQKESVDLE